MTISQMMNISRESLNNYQQALTVVSHNLANMNVDGYIKLRANFATNPSYNFGNSVSAKVRGLNGAKISDISSYADSIAADTMRHANADAAYYDELSTLLSSLSDISNELGDSGLQKTMEGFFKAVQNLSTNPTDPSIRALFVEEAQNVAAKFNSIAKQLDNLQTTLVGNWQEPATVQSSDLNVDVTFFNEKLANLAEINKQLLIAGDSGSTNGLINQREQILKELSGYADILVTQNSNGSINVSLGNTILVEGAAQAAKLGLAAGNADTPVKVQAQTMDGNVIFDNINTQIKGGKIGAVLDVVNAKDGNITINDFRNQINLLAKTFASEVNAIQTYADGDIKAMALGTNADGDTILIPSTEPIFNDDLEITAGNLTVNKKIIDKPDLIAAARVDTSVADYEKNVGNSDNAVELGQLRTKKTMATTGTGKNATFEGFLAFCAGNLAIQEKNIDAKKETADTVFEAASDNLKSINGVNIDEELADMLKYQRGYEASARLFSTANEIYQILVSLGK